MRFHILGLPHTVSSKEYVACAYTQKAVKFGKMMTDRGHEVIHYGHEDSDLQCTEHVSVTTNADLEKAYGSYDWKKNFFKFNTSDHAYQTFYRNAIREVAKRKKKNDFILPFWGSGTRPVCDAHPDLITVEPGIGYAGGHWAKWKIFESYAIMHAYQGLGAVGMCQQSWYDVVIPNYFDLDDFEYAPEKKEDYFLFLGRVYSGKGIDIAVQTTAHIGAKLIVAGQNPENRTFPDHVEFVGYADVETRKRLMSRAKASFVASTYLEPFGGVQVENLLSGTPTITTDWGAFVENNPHGLTGFRCRTFADFVDAANRIDEISPAVCRTFGEQFALENVAPRYEKFFQDVLNVYTGKGWYEL
jgi:glycosyltransferase involved in cell wall biosynthesis